MKETFEEKGKELAKEVLYKSLPEAPASVNIRGYTPDGFDFQFTMRDISDGALFDRLEDRIPALIATGYTPDKKSISKGRTEPSKGGKCPKCGADVIEFEYNGKFHKKCSENKYDKEKGQAYGCDYVEWTK